MAKKQKKPEVGYQQVKPRLGQAPMTLGHLRQVIAGYPDDMRFGPKWICDPYDEWPQLEFSQIGVEHDESFKGGARIAIGVVGHPLNEDEEDDA